jgi:hypothetical protein
MEAVTEAAINVCTQVSVWTETFVFSWLTATIWSCSDKWNHIPIANQHSPISVLSLHLIHSQLPNYFSANISSMYIRTSPITQ